MANLISRSFNFIKISPAKAPRLWHLMGEKTDFLLQYTCMSTCTSVHLVFIMRTLLCKSLLQYFVVSKGKNSFPHFALRTLLVFCYVKNNAYHVGQCTYLLSFVGKLWHFQCPSSCFRLLYVDVEAECQMPWALPGVSKWPAPGPWQNSECSTAGTDNKSKFPEVA